MLFGMDMLAIIETINGIDCALYSVVLREGKITKTVCFVTKDDAVAYLFDKDIGMWSLMGYDFDKIGGVNGLTCVTIRLYREVK